MTICEQIDKREYGSMLERAKEFLQVAEVALEKGLYNGCFANCYYALFWITILAMSRAGFKQPEWSHNGLRDKFNEELVHKRHIYPPQFTAWLSDAYSERLKAHYKASGAGIKITRRLLVHAREFFAKVEEVVTK
jgi:uncharacterized protein (UPF0332 family)